MNNMLNAAVSGFRYLTDPKVGLLQTARVFKNGGEDPRVYCAVTRLSNLEPLLGFEPNIMGSACSADLTQAVIRSSGECIERYASALYDKNNFLYTSGKALRQRCADVFPVEAFYSFSDEQIRDISFPYSRVADDEATFWVRIEQASGVEAWVPASCAFVPYKFSAHIEKFSHMPISTGLAAGQDFDLCIEKGLAEIIERDALMIKWKTLSSPLSIPADSCRGFDPDVDRLIDSVAHLDADWHINLLTDDIEVPIISAALINRAGLPLTSFGISADCSPISALKGALQEACLSRFLLNRVTEIVRDSTYVHNDLSNLRSHLLSHATSVRLRDALVDFLGNSGKSSFQDVEDRFALIRGTSIGDRINAAGLRYFWLDMTPVDLADLGFVVTRAFVPYAEPLDTNHQARHLGGRRLLSKVFDIKYRGKTGFEINDLPHPFP